MQEEEEEEEDENLDETLSGCMEELGKGAHGPTELAPPVPRTSSSTAQLPLSWPRLGQPPGSRKEPGGAGDPPAAGPGADHPKNPLS